MKVSSCLLTISVLASLAARAGLAAEVDPAVPLRHGIYAWQRNWTAPVVVAVRRAAPDVDGFSVLTAEVSWNAGEPQETLVAVDYAALAATQKPIGIVLRIGPYPGPFRQDDRIAAYLTTLAHRLMHDARQQGIDPCEVQVDFDCATAHLEGYREWATALRKAIAPVALAITVLPTWLSSPKFANLATAADGYVLQVHSLERPPNGLNAPLTLCDPAAARRWIDQAAALNRPFRVALPTYGYRVAYDAAGSYLGLTAEGPERAWPPGTQFRTVSADPVAMAELVAELHRQPPPGLQGVLWYRLPVDGDRRNWPWPTLARVMRGEVPVAKFALSIRHPEPELAEIVLRNDGETDLSAPTMISCRWRTGKRVAGDGLRGYVATNATAEETRFSRPAAVSSETLRPGEEWIVGWLRFDRPVEVECVDESLAP